MGGGDSKFVGYIEKAQAKTFERWDLQKFSFVFMTLLVEKLFSYTGFLSHSDRCVFLAETVFKVVNEEHDKLEAKKKAKHQNSVTGR